MSILKSEILKSCKSSYTGKYHLKLRDSKIINFGKYEAIIPKEDVIGKESIPMEICLKYIWIIRENGFFGDIDISINNGKVYSVEIKKKDKLENIKKIISEYEEKNGKTIVEYK